MNDRIRFKVLRLCAASVLGMLLATTISNGQQQDRKNQKQLSTVGSKAAKTQVQDKHHGHQETLGDLPARRIKKQKRTPGMVTAFGGFVSEQVNVDSNGDNIVGDAANEPSIAVNPLNRSQIAIGWRQFDTTSSNFRQAGNGFTVDGGNTWTNQQVLEPGVFRSDPVLDFNANGLFIYNSLTTGPWSCDGFNSVDGGMTWGPKVYAFGGDKQWMTVDRSGGMGDGHIYVAWSPFFSCCTGFFTRSSDDGATYETPIELPFELYWGTLSVGPDGALYICGTLQTGQPIVIKSTNAQDSTVTPTFPSFSFVDLGGVIEISEGPNPSGLLGQFWVATDHSGGPNHGNVYMLGSVNPDGPDPLDIGFARSTDGGATWSTPQRLNNDPQTAGAFQWFGTMSVAPNGRIDVIWNDSRNDTSSPYTSAMYYTNSTDGGLTWSAQIPVTQPWNPHLGHPNQNKIGDYYDMLSDECGVDIAYAATFNGEQDVYHMRIELADSVNPVSTKLLDGVVSEGDINDLLNTDNQYLSLDPSPTNNLLKQKVDLILQGTSPVSTPTVLKFVLEAKMLGSQFPGDVNQSVALLNYETGKFEAVDVRPASVDDTRFYAVPTGDPSRFVQSGTNEITASLTWKSESFAGPPYTWSLEIDQAIWMVN